MEAYNNQVRLHAAQGQAFADHLKAWNQQVQAYGQCEVGALNAENEGH